MSDLVEFLRARLDEDEAAARQAVVIRKRDYSHQPWVDDPDYTFRAWDDYPSGVLMVGPERGLREVEVKRLLIHAAAHDAGAGNAEGAWAELVLSELASIYADHPDYRQEWA